MNPTVIGFGAWRLLPQARELWRDQQQVALPPRAFDCLVYLVEHRDRAVGRDELISAVWGRTDVSDSMVAQTVLRIRRTLDDDGSGREWIRTAPRFGYRWVAPVTAAADAGMRSDATDTGAGDPQPVPASPAATAERPGRSRPPVLPLALALALAAAIIVLLVAILLMRPRDDIGEAAASDAPTGGRDTWLVLPVVGEGHAAPEWIRLGAMDAIAEQLRRGGLAVLPSSQALTLATEFATPGQPPDIGNLRIISGSRYVVQPHSAQIDQHWRISLTVHDPGHGPILYRGMDADLLAAAQQAGRALLASQGLVDHGGDSDGPRGELLARAEAALLAGRLTEAEALLDERPAALADDPLILLKLAQARYRLGDTAGAQVLIESVLARADIDNNTRALALVRGGNAHIRAGQFPDAEQLFTQALALLGDAGNPELQGEAWNGLGVSQQMRGEMAHAATSLARAAALLQNGGDPLAYARTLINLGLHAMEASRPHEASDRFLLAEPMVLRFGGADEQSGLQQSIAWARLFLAQPGAAREPSARALAVAAGTENPRVRRQALGLAIRVAVANGELDHADALIGQYADMTADQAASLLPLYQALIAEGRRDWPRVRDHAIGLLDGTGIGERDARGLSAELALSAASALDDVATATRALAVLAAVADNDPGGRWPIRERLSRARFDLARDAADEAADQLLAVWNGAGRARLAPADQLDVGLALVDALVAAGDLDQAQRLFEQLLPWADGDHRLALADAAIARGQADQPRVQAALARARQLAGERVLPGWTTPDH